MPSRFRLAGATNQSAVGQLFVLLAFGAWRTTLHPLAGLLTSTCPAGHPQLLVAGSNVAPTRRHRHEPSMAGKASGPHAGPQTILPFGS